MGTGSRWPEVSGAILAGGKGSRFHGDKRGLLVNGAPVLARLAALLGEFCAQVVVSLGPGQKLSLDGGVQAVEDLFPGRGPLAGIHAALAATPTEACLVVACDMPFVSRAILGELLRHYRPGHAVAFELRGYIEPFPGLYPRTLLPRMEAALRVGELGVQRFLRRCPLVLVPEAAARALDPELRSFLNVNTAAELQLFQEEL